MMRVIRPEAGETIRSLTELIRVLRQQKSKSLRLFSCFGFGEVVDLDELKGGEADLQV